MIRVLLLILITLAMLTQYFWLGIIIAFFYMFKYVGYELAVVAVLIDGYYGAFYSVPILSIFTVLILLIINILKPFLLMYTDNISNR